MVIGGIEGLWEIVGIFVSTPMDVFCRTLVFGGASKCWLQPSGLVSITVCLVALATSPTPVKQGAPTHSDDTHNTSINENLTPRNWNDEIQISICCLRSDNIALTNGYNATSLSYIQAH